MDLSRPAVRRLVSFDRTCDSGSQPRLNSRRRASQVTDGTDVDETEAMDDDAAIDEMEVRPAGLGLREPKAKQTHDRAGSAVDERM